MKTDENTFRIIKNQMRLETADGADHAFRAFFTPGEDFPPFEGHFPDRKILPGVAQICLVTSAMRLFLKEDLMLKEIRRVKFLNPAMPEKELCLDLDLKKDENTLYAVNARISGGEKIISKMQLIYGK